MNDRYDLWLTDEVVWKEQLAANATSGYGLSVLIAAALWMLGMQARIADGASVEDCAADAFSEANRALGSWSLTVFQYGACVSILASVWKHGEELRRWHNLRTQFGSEGEKANAESGAVLNPALLSMSAGDDSAR